MTESFDQSVVTKDQRGFAPLFLSYQFRWLYRAILAFLFLAGMAFIALGIQQLWYRVLSTGLIYTSIGVVILIAAFGVRQVRQYLYSLQAAAVERIDSIELEKFDESDFEHFDRVRALRDEKARRDFERNLKAKCQIRHLHARNIVLFPVAEWELQPGVNVLLGRNGYGKSLILRAIAGLLQREEDATNSLFAGLDDSDDSPSQVEVRLSRDEADALIRRNAVRFSDSIGKVPLLAIPDSRFLDRSQQVVGPVDSDTSDLRVFGAYHFLHQLPFGSVIQGLLYEICLDYWEHGKTFKRPIFDFFQECVQRLTGFDFRFHSIQRSGQTGFTIRVITEGNPEPLPIQYASQGTLSVLAMFGLIRSYLRALSDRTDDSLVQAGSAIVLIDEADAHLHPTWQQKVPSLLKHLFPNVQFILSAHSPLFVAGCWKGEVAVLRRLGSDAPAAGFTIQQLDRDFVGATSAELYEQIFEVEELDDTYLSYSTKASLPNGYSERINQLTEFRETRSLSQSEEQELLRLTEESRRILSAVDVRQRRRQESDKDLRIDELKSKILKLENQLAVIPEEKSS
jgi:predicted ATPase